MATNSLYKKIRESHFYKKLVFTTAQQEITYSKLIIKTKEQRQLRGSGVFIANFEYISRFFLVFLLITLGREIRVGKLSSQCSIISQTPMHF